MRDVQYYLIWDRIVGKRDAGEDYIFRHGQWEPDKDWLIMDRLVGYDPSEPPDSPYGIGNGSVMAEMEEISYGRAMELTGGIQ